MIKVRIFGVVRLQTGVSCDETNARSLRELLGSVPGLTEKEARDLVVLVNGKSVGRHYRFQDGDEVALLAPAGGG